MDQGTSSRSAPYLVTTLERDNVYENTWSLKIELRGGQFRVYFIKKHLWRIVWPGIKLRSACPRSSVGFI
jgi:hypothetical protein